MARSNGGIERRRFLKLAAAAAVAPSEKIVMGSIGVGNMGTGHVRGFLQQADARIVAVADPREQHRERARALVDKQYGDKGCATYADFRELLARPDIDAVMIAVPDHWHALIGLEAARRGKDMYYEKPLALTVAEAKAIRAAVRRYGVVFQFGTQQRSSNGYRHACELVRNGRIGQLQTIMIGSAQSQYVPDQSTQPVPEGFDYDMWLGPAPWAPYTFERCTRNWTLIYDYSLGCLSGAWGIHDVDIAQWANGTELTTPIEVEGTGKFPKDGLYDTPVSWEVEHKYANGVKLIHMDLRTARGRAAQFRLGSMATVLTGSAGWIRISRDGMQTEPASLVRAVIGPNEIRLPRSTDHRRDFLDAVRTRRDPIAPIEGAATAEFICQQDDIAIRMNRKLRWDPVREEFIGDAQANRMLSRPMRSPWHL